MPLAIPKCDVADPGQLEPLNASFAKDGYIILQNLVPEALIDEIAEQTHKLFWSAEGELKEPRLQDLWRKSEAVKCLATHEKILSQLEELYGRAPVPFQTLNFPVGTQQRTHSDTIHFHCLPQRFMCGVWVALEDIGEDDGPLHLYPGSHRLPVIDCPEADIEIYNVDNTKLISKKSGYEHYLQYEQSIQELIEIAALEKKTFTAQKGDILIWAANLLHGGEAVKNPNSTRLSQVTHYYFEGCRYYTPLLSNTYENGISYRDSIVNISTGNLQPQVALNRSIFKGLFGRIGRKLDKIFGL